MVNLCQSEGCANPIESNTVSISDNFVDAIGYIKASNTGANDRFSNSIISLSGDGNNLYIADLVVIIFIIKYFIGM